MNPLKCRFLLHVVAIFALLWLNPRVEAALQCSDAHGPEIRTESFGRLQLEALDAFVAQYGIGSERRGLHWTSLQGTIGSRRSSARTPENSKWSVTVSDRSHPEYDKKDAAPLPPIQKSHFETFDLPTETLTVPDLDRNSKSQSQFQLFNIGFRQLAKDWPLIEKSYRDGVRENPGKNVTMTFHPAFVQTFYKLVNLHYWAANIATNVYSKRKGYLNEDDLFDLKASDASAESHDDFLILQKESTISPLEMTFEEFEENTLAMVRLVRIGYGDIFFPQSLQGRGSHRQLPVSKRFYRTPIGDRIEDAITELYFLAGKNIAEISRLVRVQEMPNVLLNHLMKNIFELSLKGEEPTDILIISVDEKTRALFKRQYQFKDLAPLTDGRVTTPEYLMYHDTHSKEFRTVLANLQSLSSPVQQIRSSSFPHEPKKLKANELPKNWLAGSPEEKRQKTKVRIAEYREEIKHRPFLIDWEIQLGDTSPKGLQRIEAIVHWAYHSLNADIRKKYAQLSSQDRQTLTERATLFSTSFESLASDSLGSIKKNEDVLILGHDAKLFAQLVRKELDPQKIHTGDLESIEGITDPRYDRIIFHWTDIQNFSEEHVKATLKKIHRVLRPLGYLVVSAPFIYESPQHARLSQSDLIEYSQELIRNGSPISEKELALEIVARAKFIEQKEKGWLRFAPFTKYLFDIGLRNGTGSSGGCRNPMYCELESTFQKLEESR